VERTSFRGDSPAEVPDFHSALFRQLTVDQRAIYKVQMLILLQDAQSVPRVFYPFGAISTAELREWLTQNALVLPSDLIELWEATGGGDIFDSETIFRPTVPSIPNTCFVEDDIEGRNAAHAAKGKPSGFYIFQQGVFLSAIRLSDQKFVTLTKNYAIENSFGSFDDWYVQNLRATFGEEYGLSPLRT
jgi:hypothetical protein